IGGHTNMLMQKNTVLISCLNLFLLLLVGCGSSNQPSASQRQNPSQGSDKVAESKTDNKEEVKAEPITLKLATFMPVDHPWTKAVTDPFMARVTELTNGQVNFEYYPAQQLGKAADLLMLAGDGVTDI